MIFWGMCNKEEYINICDSYGWSTYYCALSPTFVNRGSASFHWENKATYSPYLHSQMSCARPSVENNWPTNVPCNALRWGRYFPARFNLEHLFDLCGDANAWTPWDCCADLISSCPYFWMLRKKQPMREIRSECTQGLDLYPLETWAPVTCSWPQKDAYETLVGKWGHMLCPPWRMVQNRKKKDWTLKMMLFCVFRCG